MRVFESRSIKKLWTEESFENTDSLSCISRIKKKKKKIVESMGIQNFVYKRGLKFFWIKYEFSISFEQTLQRCGTESCHSTFYISIWKKKKSIEIEINFKKLLNTYIPSSFKIFQVVETFSRREIYFSSTE